MANFLVARAPRHCLTCAQFNAIDLTKRMHGIHGTAYAAAHMHALMHSSPSIERWSWFGFSNSFVIVATKAHDMNLCPTSMIQDNEKSHTVLQEGKNNTSIPTQNWEEKTWR